jgi:predicted PurR-regulated permease PerM
LLVALAVAYILNPTVVSLEKKLKSRKRAVIVVFAAFIIVSGGFGTWIVITIVGDVQGMRAHATDIVEDIQENQEEWIGSYNELVPTRLQLDPQQANFDSLTKAALGKLITPTSQAETPEEGQARAALVGAKAALLTNFQAADADKNMRLSDTEIGATLVAAMDHDEDGAVAPGEWFKYFGASDPRPEGTTLTPQALSTLEGGGASLLDGLFRLLTIILFIVLVPIYTWYFMLGFDRFSAKVYTYLPGAHRPRVERLLKEVDGMLRAFFRGRVVVVLVIGAASTILFLSFGVQYAVLLGLLSGLGVLIPYFSIIAGWVPAVLLMLIARDSVWSIVVMSIIFHAIQAIEQYYLTPKILGDAVELHPVTLLVGVFVMASLFGLFGALLAVPLTAIAKTLGREFLLPYFKSLAAEKPS